MNRDDLICRLTNTGITREIAETTADGFISAALMANAERDPIAALIDNLAALRAETAAKVLS